MNETEERFMESYDRFMKEVRNLGLVFELWVLPSRNAEPFREFYVNYTDKRRIGFNPKNAIQ